MLTKFNLLIYRIEEIEAVMAEGRKEKVSIPQLQK